MYSSTTSSTTSSTIQEYLYVQLDNYPSIKSFVSSKLSINGTPYTGVVFLPQTLRAFDQEIAANSGFIVELYSFLDIISSGSYLFYQDHNQYFTDTLDMIIRNRVTVTDSDDTRFKSVNENIVLGAEYLKDYTLSSTEGTLAFLKSNRLIVSLYVYVLISSVYSVSYASS